MEAQEPYSSEVGQCPRGGASWGSEAQETYSFERKPTQQRHGDFQGSVSPAEQRSSVASVPLHFFTSLLLFLATFDERVTPGRKIS